MAIRDGATKASRVATYRIQGRPSVSVGDASVTEGNAGTTPLSFPVTLSAASTQPVSVTYATADGTATAPSDYAAASGTSPSARARRRRPSRSASSPTSRSSRTRLSRSPSPAPWARRSPAPPRPAGSRTTTPRSPSRSARTRESSRGTRCSWTSSTGTSRTSARTTSGWTAARRGSTSTEPRLGRLAVHDPPGRELQRLGGLDRDGVGEPGQVPRRAQRALRRGRTCRAPSSARSSTTATERT